MWVWLLNVKPKREYSLPKIRTSYNSFVTVLQRRWSGHVSIIIAKANTDFVHLRNETLRFTTIHLRGMKLKVVDIFLWFVHECTTVGAVLELHSPQIDRSKYSYHLGVRHRLKMPHCLSIIIIVPILPLSFLALYFHFRVLHTSWYLTVREGTPICVVKILMVDGISLSISASLQTILHCLYSFKSRIRFFYYAYVLLDVVLSLCDDWTNFFWILLYFLQRRSCEFLLDAQRIKLSRLGEDPKGSGHRGGW